jgi:hypothetical protein
MTGGGKAGGTGVGDNVDSLVHCAQWGHAMSSPALRVSNSIWPPHSLQEHFENSGLEVSMAQGWANPMTHLDRHNAQSESVLHGQRRASSRVEVGSGWHCPGPAIAGRDNAQPSSSPTPVPVREANFKAGPFRAAFHSASPRVARLHVSILPVR